MSLSIRQIVNGSFGVEISGVNFASAVASSVTQAVYDTFLQHSLVVFRDQALSPGRLVEVAQYFGDVTVYPFAKGMEGHPEVTEIVKESHQTSNFGGMWHTDTTYLAEPPKCTLLYAVETPPAGKGDTMLTDMYQAYDTLSEDVKEKLAELRAIQTSAINADVLRGDHLASGSMAHTVVCSETDALAAAHPVIRTHPETGKRAIFVNPSHTERFEGQTADESQPLLQELFAHSIRPEFTTRVRWEPGTLVVWDNRSTMHSAVNDYDGHRRVMRRVTVAGDVPV